MNLAGHRLGEFEILERVGQGGMGAVYKARQTSLRRTVALKTLQASLAEDAEYIARFEQEAVAAAGLSHPNLVQVYSAGETDGLHWFAMEYVEGESAKARLQRKGRLDPLEAIAIVIHVAAALEYGWRKAALIHRDIKPDNIFLSEDGEVKLGDLGLAKSAGQTQGLTMTGHSMGSPHYISPEQVECMKDVDLRADIYSLGCTLYHMVSGHAPYDGNSAVAIMMKHVNAPVPELRKVWPECPGELAAIVMKMMLKPPEERPQSYGEVNAELRRVYDMISGTTVPDTIVTTSQYEAGMPQVGTSLRDVRGENPGRPGSPNVPAAPSPVRRHLGGASLPPPPKSKLPLYAGIGAVVLALAAAAFFLFRPKEENLTKAQIYARDHAAEQSASAARGTRSGASQESAADQGRAGAHPSEATKDAPFVNSLGMKFVPVPIVSGPSAGQTVLFSVWDTRVQDYAAYAAANPKVDGAWKTQNKDGMPAGRELNHPVVGVSWEDAQAFCQWLTAKEQAEGKLPKGVKYRLPSDEEWSWAVGLPPELGSTPAEKNGKNSVDFPWGKDYPPTKKVGNYADESFHQKFPNPDAKDPKITNQWIAGYDDGYPTTSPVGSFPANAYGLYDMGGNVRQWCEDWYDASHKDRVLRGASWGNYDRGSLLSSFRVYLTPGYRDRNNGFRCVLAMASPALAPAPDNQGRVASPRPPTHQGTLGESSIPLATKEAPFVNSLGMKFVPVPIVSGPSAGQTVLFSVWDVRVRDYATYAAANPMVDGSWKTQNKDGVPAGRELDHPVVGVSWEDAQGFCQWLTEKEIVEGKLPKGLKYRLPTDEEWSWAVGMPPEVGSTPAEKAGKNSVDFPWGKDYPPTKKVGNYADESFHQKFPKPDAKDPKITNGWIEGYNDGYATTSPVASFPANAYGLYDMGGNVRQWCEDWFDASQKDRVLRGASWDYYDRGGLLSSNRTHNVPGYRNHYSGFRCVVAPEALQEGRAPARSQTSVGEGGEKRGADNRSESEEGAVGEGGRRKAALSSATKDAPFVNSLGMKFVPVPIPGGLAQGHQPPLVPGAAASVLFSVWDTRVQDYAVYAAAKKVDDAWTKQQRDNVPAGRELNHPVVGVSWEDAQAFCQWLTEKEIAEGKLPKGLRYRLPTDEEWSWAVGLPPELGATPAEKSQKNSVDFPWGKDYPPTKKVGNYADEAFHAKFPKDSTDKKKDQSWIVGYDDDYATTSPVGSFPANAYGLYDMGGNVWQWCEDWVDASHKERVLRGASWDYTDRGSLLSSRRHHDPPGGRNYGHGFRCVVGVSAR